jgi:hypothetical protein
MSSEDDRTTSRSKGEKEELARTAWIAGIVSLGAVAVPPGLFITPISAIAALALGAAARSHADGAGAAKASAAMLMGGVALVAWGFALYLFGPTLLRVISDIRHG